MMIRVKLSRAENLEYFGCISGDIVQIEMEEYVAGVVGSEIGNAPPDACRAQAIAARTFAMRCTGEDRYITDKSSVHQAFRVSRWDAGKYPNANAAAMETAGMVLTYGGEIIRTCSYSSSNGGRTVSSEERWGGMRPYLIAQDDPWDAAECARRKKAGLEIEEGHGVGMSQYGAVYAARNGAGYREILGFYYPGTKIMAAYGAAGMEETDMGTTEERALIPFTNEHFAAFMKAMLGRPYWYGTCIYKCSTNLLSRKKKQYPGHYRSSRMDTYREHIAGKEVCGDCIGAAKGYAWTNAGEGVVEAIGTDKSIQSKYGSHGCPDKGTSSMFAYAKEQGMPWGTIATLPEIVGIAVTYSGHVGYYMGGGCVIEFKGFDHGCVMTALSDGRWTHWYMLPFLDYGDHAAAEEERLGCTLGARLLQKGCKGDDVAYLQRLLLGMGYDLGSFGKDGDGVDGKYGDMTVKAVKRFQTYAQISVDGKYGSVTHKALMGVLDDLEKSEGNEDAAGPDTGMMVLVTEPDTDVRSGPADTYKIITCVEKDVRLPYIATAAASEWYALELGGKIGWIPGTRARLEGEACAGKE